MAPHQTRSSKNKEARDHESVEENAEQQAQVSVNDETSDETLATAGDKRKKNPQSETVRKATKATKSEQATTTHERDLPKSNPTTEQVMEFLFSDAATKMCRPEDELEDLEKRGNDIKTYVQLRS